MKHQEAPDLTKFPAPHRWATWMKDRSSQFKTHSSLGLAKNALSGRPTGHGQYRTVNGKQVYDSPLEGGYVYEWVDDEWGEGWVERFHVPYGTFKTDHPLWSFTERTRKARPVTQKAIDAAIASIQQD